MGVWQDLTGSSTKQVTELISKVRNIHAAISKSPLPRHLNWIGLRQAIWKSIEYVLTATTLSRIEAALLAKELYRPLLPKLGCNRNFPLLLRYNPPFLLGLGLHDPYLEQGLRKLELLLTHGGLDSMTGQLLQSSLEHHQLEIGSFTPFFQLLFRDHIHLTSPTWMTVLWEFVRDHDIDLSHHSSPRMGPLRVNDRALMDIFKEHNITTKESTSINKVRGYLEVFTLADITTGDGNKIRQCFKLGIKSDTKSLWDWHEERPSQLDLAEWKRAMTLLVDGTNKLHKPLGKWIAKPHHDWLWYYSMKDDKIYRKGPKFWTSYILGKSATRFNPIYTQDINVIADPTNISLTTVKVISNRTIVFEGTDFTDKDVIPNLMAVKCNSFWILDNSNIKDRYNESWVVAGLLKGNLRAVCDGSYKPKLTEKGTTAGWIIENNTSTSNITGTVATRGITADAYRGELLGIYAILSTISYIEKYNRHFTTGSINIGCDNEKAGWISGKSNPMVSSTSKHFDLVRAIRRLNYSLQTTVIFYHIYGHQDKNLPYYLLPRPAQLNVIVDDLAQVQFDRSHENSSFHSNVFFYHEGWSVAIGGVKLQDKILPHIRNWIAKRKLRKYLFEKDLIAWNMFPHIDFEVLRIYMSAQSRAFQLWYAKHWTNFCGIGVKMKQMKLWDNDLCPCCQQVSESTTTHLFLCPHPTVAMAREKVFHKILTWLETINTESLLLEIITAFWHGENLILDKECPKSLKNIYNTLRDIGLHQMWMGMIPVGMIEYQTEYYQLIGSKKSGKKWGLDLVQKMIRATHSLWMERNNLLHLRAANGIRGLCNIALQTAVSQQYNLGHEGLEEEDFYLLDTDQEELIKEPAEMIRGWLCEILIARGDLASARLESLKDRGEITHVIPILTAIEQRSYLDWRKVCLQRKS